MTTKFNPSALRPWGIKTPLIKLWPRNRKTLAALAEANVQTIEDLLLILPLRLQKIPPKAPFTTAQEGELFQGEGKIINVQARPNFYGRGKRGVLLQNIRMTVQDTSSPSLMLLCWFNAYPSVAQKLKSLERIIFWGKVGSFQGRVQIVNPVYQDAAGLEVGPTSPSSSSSSLPSPAFSSAEFKIQYPTVNKVTPIQIQNLFKKLPAEVWELVADKLPPPVLKKRDFFSKKQSLQILHGLTPDADQQWQRAMQSLVYEEFFLRQIKTILRKQFLQKVAAPKMEATYQLDLPFALTSDQQRVLQEIEADLVLGHPMMRLLQGDVGCGKTVVAFLAASKVLASGWQVAVMCPTESLALQHFKSWQKLGKLNQDFPAQLLLGSTSSKEKALLKQHLQDGSYSIVIGTHALIQEDMKFAKLGLAIIDEQHKFGVQQRLALLNHHAGTHCLIMTATPIPRSLRLTQYGDLEVSSIMEMPQGRKAIKTRIVAVENREKYLQFLRGHLGLGQQAYIVVPAIEEGEFSLAALESVFQEYQKKFAEYHVAYLHGRMKADDKAKILQDFAVNKIQLLITTTVVEVGIDVPNATIMTIYNPERFGLSQLHQLRGRVGRGAQQSFCFLIDSGNLSNLALQRLQVFEVTNDGFKIAEHDLELRGEGDIFGDDQSGDPHQGRMANLLRYPHLLVAAQEDVQQLMQENNPQFKALIQEALQDLPAVATI